MQADVKAKVEQISPSVVGEGEMGYLRMSKIGQLWTADWKYKLIAAGKAYRMSFGTIADGTDIGLGGDATGGIDLDQPEGWVAVDSGVLIPMELQISGTCVLDGLADDAQILLTADRTQACVVADLANGTAETPDNLLDGGPAFGGRAASLQTTDLTTDPVHSDVLFYNIWSNMIAAGTATNIGPAVPNLTAYKDFLYPTFLAGACSLLLYAAGEAAYAFAGSLVFAHIPRSWIPLS